MPKFAVTLKRVQEFVVHLNAKSKDVLYEALMDAESLGEIDNSMEGYFNELSSDYEFDIQPVKGRVKTFDRDKMMQSVIEDHLDYCED